MVNIEFVRTSQGVDVFIAAVRIAAVIDCPALGFALVRRLSGELIPFVSVNAAVLALTMAVEKAKVDGKLNNLTEL